MSRYHTAIPDPVAVSAHLNSATLDAPLLFFLMREKVNALAARALYTLSAP